MSETVCIHGTPIDPWYIHCDKCQHMADLPPVDPDALLASWWEEEQLRNDLPEETGE